MTVVFKLGGSLLDLPDLTDLVQNLIERDYSNRPILFLVGGGLIVDAVRRYDSIHHFRSDTCHWLCVELMNSTAAMFQQLCHWPLLTNRRILADWLLTSNISCSAPAIVAPSAFYSQSLNSSALPLSWRCTSDSIAALLARLVNASELVMLKSTEAIPSLVEPIVDETFASVVPQSLTVRFVNIRSYS